MVSRAQIEKLDSRIDALAAALGANPDGGWIEYDVRLVWIEMDGGLTNDDGTSYMHEPGVVMLDVD